MSKLYFKYGAMGSSKTANLLITKFNYEEKGKKVLLLKPSSDTRDGADMVRSRIGLEEKAFIIRENKSILDDWYEKIEVADVILIDEAQFLSEEQVDELHEIVLRYGIPVICYGLLTDFTSHLFPGSKRLVEISESLQEIKTICECGRKATCNARFNEDGVALLTGDQVVMGAMICIKVCVMPVGKNIRAMGTGKWVVSNFYL